MLVPVAVAVLAVLAVAVAVLAVAHLAVLLLWRGGLLSGFLEPWAVRAEGNCGREMEGNSGKFK